MGKKYKILIPMILLVSLLTQSLLGCGDFADFRKQRNEQKQETWEPSPADGLSKETDVQGNTQQAAGNPAEIEQQDALEQGQPKEPVQSISGGKYAYECLKDDEKAVYDQMLATILSHEEKVELSTVDTEKMRRAYTAINSDYGGLFWVDGYVFTTYTRGEDVVGLEFAPSYTMDRDSHKEIQRQIDEVVESWLSGISISDSDYAKAKYVFETLIQQVDYVEDSQQNQNIISVFLNRQTVCQGYACATQYLLQQLGVSCTIVSGTANGQSHAWNLVLLDGEYYHMDTTWGNSTYLGTDSQEAKFVNYNYFTLTTDELLETHTPSGELVLPECTSVTDNYYVQEGRWIDIYDIDQIGSIYAEAWNEGQQSCSVKFATEELYQQAYDALINQQKIAEYCVGMEYVYYLKNDDLQVLTINFT